MILSSSTMQGGATGRAEEELGDPAPPVPGAECGDRHCPQEGTQGEDGGRDEAARERY